jgi:hypothetical protein
MKYSLLLLALLSSAAIAKDVYVQPHIRSDGTYVQGHHRTAPDSNPYNNYGAQGNTNPYTGNAGNVAPQTIVPTYQMPTYPAYNPYDNNRGQSAIGR